MKKLAASLLLLGGFPWLFAQVVPSPGLLNRRYQEGETMVYRMKNINNGRRSEIQATGVVKRDSRGQYLEEYAWSNRTLDGAPFNLPPKSMQFRQILSLDPGMPSPIPNLSEVHPTLIGPITDFLTFYADLWLATRSGKLKAAGDHLYHEHATPASWADGNRVVLGETSIDFDITLTGVDQAGKIATLLVKHVPPKRPEVRLPAAWMNEAVADTPNNWVQVSKSDGKYTAMVGKETFDVQLKVSLVDGKILSGTLENQVKTRVRDCLDAALMSCGDPRPREILRQVDISLVP